MKFMLKKIFYQMISVIFLYNILNMLVIFEQQHRVNYHDETGKFGFTQVRMNQHLFREIIKKKKKNIKMALKYFLDSNTIDHGCECLFLAIPKLHSVSDFRYVIKVFDMLFNHIHKNKYHLIACHS